MDYNFATGMARGWQLLNNQENFASGFSTNYPMAWYGYQQQAPNQMFNYTGHYPYGGHGVFYYGQQAINNNVIGANGFGQGYQQWTSTSTGFFTAPTGMDSGFIEHTQPNSDLLVDVSNNRIPHQLEMERPKTPLNWKNNPYITLHAEDWNRFREVGEPEQLANNDGRRLFPTLYFTVSELTPETEYEVSLQMSCVSKELCFNEETKEWKPKTKRLAKIDVPQLSNDYMAVSKTGAQWMAEGIDLSGVKLYTIGARTIKKELKPGMIRVYPLHRYVPKLTISEKVEGAARMVVHEETFEAAAFIAVSKIKNQHINQLRTQENSRSRYRDKHAQ